MKNLIAGIFLIFLADHLSAQHIDDGTYLYDSHSFNNTKANRETIIWSEDFSNGIPANWTNSGSPALALWEYRGPLTLTDNTAGTRGSCLPEGQESGAPIDSESLDNGFVIFDSNYWDDEEGPCGNFGSGLAVAPHASSLTTNAINLSAYPYVGLEFNQYTKNYTSIHRVQLSINNQPFFDVFSQTLGLNSETSRDEVVSVNISQFAGFQANVKVRFLFEGTYYFWMIDDVKLIALDPNDLSLNEPTYGDFDINNPDHSTGFEYLEYSIYPQAMLSELKFSAAIANDGGLVQTNVNLNVSLDRVSAPNENLYSDQSESILLNPGYTEVLRAGTYSLDPIVGDYELTFSANQSEVDDQPENNVKQKLLSIAPTLYARDHRSLEGVYIPAPQQQSIPYEFGNIYLITAANQQIHSVECGISLGSLTGSQIYAALYEFDLSNGVNAEFVAQSGSFSIEGDDLNNLGEEKMISLIFDSPVALNNGMAYAVMVGSLSGAPFVLSGISGDAPALTSWVYYPESEGWFFLSKMPMVRMNLDDNNSVNNVEGITDIIVWPNPTQNNININSKNLDIIEVYNLAGELVKSEKVNANTTTHSFTIAEFASSIYVLKVLDINGFSYFKKILKY